MKKNITRFINGVIILVILFLLSSCDFLKTDDDIIEDKIEELINAMENENKEELKNLFAKTKIDSIDDFDESINNLFDYYNGSFVSKVNYPHGKFADKHYEFTTTWFLPSIDVTTDVEVYRIAFYYCTEYTTDKDSIGIWSLYVLKMKDYNKSSDTVYRGDGLWTPGINIGKIKNDEE